MTTKGSSDKSTAVQLPGRIRVSWSVARAYPGAEVKVHVRTDNIVDDAAVELEIKTADDAKDVDKVSGKIKGNKLDHAYKLDWKDKGALGKSEFTVKATIGAVASDLATIVIDCEPLLFSA